MSLVVARKKRTALYLSIAGLLAMVAAVSAVSAGDPSGTPLRVGMILTLVGVALWLPWQALLPAALLLWLGPNYARCLLEDTTLFSSHMMYELGPMLGLALFSGMTRHCLRTLEDEDRLLGATHEEFSGIDIDTGVYQETLMRPAIEAELVRSRRFNRQFALVLVGIEEMRQKFDYRDEEMWDTSFNATASLLRSTRTNIDRAYRFGDSSFALILPESGEREVSGLIRRLRRVARVAKPAEGDPGGPLPTHFGATFFPTCATTTEDLLRRAEVALRVAEKSSTRVQIDGAEAPDMAPPETLRRPELEAVPTLVSEEAAMEVPADIKPVAAIIEAEPEVAAIVEMPSPVIVPMPVRQEPIVARTFQPEPVVEPAPLAPVLEPTPLFSTPTPLVSAPAAIEEPAHVEPAAVVEVEAPVVPTPMPERRPFTVVSPLPAPEIVPAMQVVQQPAMAVQHEPAIPAPLPIVAEAADAPADDTMTDLMKHLDETLAMIRSLRTGSAAS